MMVSVFYDGGTEISWHGWPEDKHLTFMCKRLFQLDSFNKKSVHNYHKEVFFYWQVTKTLKVLNPERAMLLYYT